MKFLIVLVIAIIAVEGYEEEGCLSKCGMKVDGYKRAAICRYCCPIGTQVNRVVC